MQKPEPTPVYHAPPKVYEPSKPHEMTDAEKKLKEEAEKAKTKLIDEINSFKIEDPKTDSSEPEQEDPRVQKFLVQNPVKIGGNVKYTVTGVDDEGEFSEVRRFREFHALG